MAEPAADAGIFMGLKYPQDLPLICWICLDKSLLSGLEGAILLVYGSSFTFEPAIGPQQIINCVARWAGRRANRSSVDPVVLSQGVRELRLKDGSTLTSRVTLDEEQRPVYPFEWLSEEKRLVVGYCEKHLDF